MELSVHFIDFLPGAPDRLATTVSQAAVAAEEAGATMFTLADHFFQMEEMGRAQDPFLEVYTTLGFLAGQTRSIALAPLVTGVTYRHPGVLAKTATTVDVLSGGRLVFGILASIVEFERELIRGRVRSGLAAARARGKRIGRPRVAIDQSKIAALRNGPGRRSQQSSGLARARFSALAKHPPKPYREMNP